MQRILCLTYYNIFPYLCAIGELLFLNVKFCKLDFAILKIKRYICNNFSRIVIYSIMACG